MYIPFRGRQDAAGGRDAARADLMEGYVGLAMDKYLIYHIAGQDQETGGFRNLFQLIANEINLRIYNRCWKPIPAVWRPHLCGALTVLTASYASA
jgi:hypothetical protein